MSPPNSTSLNRLHDIRIPLAAAIAILAETTPPPSLTLTRYFYTFLSSTSPRRTGLPHFFMGNNVTSSSSSVARFSLTPSKYACLLEGVCCGLTHFVAELSWVYSLAVAATLCWLVCLPISARILRSYLHATKKLFNSHYLLIVNFELNWISPTRKGENSSYESADPFILPLSPVVFATLTFLAVPFLLEDFLHLLVSKSNGSWWYLGAQRSVWVRKTIPHGEVHVVITNGSGHCLRQPNLTPVERES